MARKHQSLISGNNSSSDGGILSRISESTVVQKGKAAACDAAYVAKRLIKSTGKAAWVTTTYFIVLGLPLLYVMERDVQLNEMEMQQASLLGTAPAQLTYGRY